MTQKLSELQSLVVVGKNVQNNSETLTFHKENVEKWLHRIVNWCEVLTQMQMVLKHDQSFMEVSFKVVTKP